MASLDDVVTQLQGIVNNLSGLTQTSSSASTSTSTTPTTTSVFNVMASPYNAVGDNSADDTSAIQQAIDAAGAAGGGIVWFPQPSVAYKITSKLRIGNGTTASASTYGNVRLVGAGGMGISFQNEFVSNYPNNGIILNWQGGSTDAVVEIEGPLFGWGLENLVIDCNSGVADVALKVFAAGLGFCKNVTLLHAGVCGLLSTCRSTQTSPGFTSCIHNKYLGLLIETANVAGSTAIHLDGTSVGNTDFNTFINTWISIGYGATLNYGIILGACDSNTFIDTHMSGSGSGVVGVRFDYLNSVGIGFPNSCCFYGIDLGAALSGTPWQNNGGTPGNPWPHQVFNVQLDNGGTPPVGISDVAWQSVYVGSSVPVNVSDLAQTWVGSTRGGRAVVKNATVALSTTSVGTIVAGGGSNTVPVIYDGTNWLIGG